MLKRSLCVCVSTGAASGQRGIWHGAWALAQWRPFTAGQNATLKWITKAACRASLSSTMQRAGGAIGQSACGMRHAGWKSASQRVDSHNKRLNRIRAPPQPLHHPYSYPHLHLHSPCQEPVPGPWSADGRATGNDIPRAKCDKLIVWRHTAHRVTSGRGISRLPVASQQRR